MTDYLDTLSDFVSETGFDSLTPGALDAVRDVTLDTLGAMVVGSQQPENAAFASQDGAALAIGHGDRVRPRPQGRSDDRDARQRYGRRGPRGG